MVGVLLIMTKICISLAHPNLVFLDTHCSVQSVFYHYSVSGASGWHNEKHRTHSHFSHCLEISTISRTISSSGHSQSNDQWDASITRVKSWSSSPRVYPRAWHVHKTRAWLKSGQWQLSKSGKCYNHRVYCLSFNKYYLRGIMSICPTNYLPYIWLSRI